MQDADLWDILHDGIIVSITGTVPGDLELTVSIGYLASLFDETQETIKIRLKDCDCFVFAPYGCETSNTHRLTNLSELSVADIDIHGNWPYQQASLSEYGIKLSVSEANAHVINCSDSDFGSGALIVRYVRFELALGNGTAITLQSLSDKCDEYWVAFSERS